MLEHYKLRGRRKRCKLKVRLDPAKLQTRLTESREERGPKLKLLFKSNRERLAGFAKRDAVVLHFH